MRTELSAHGVLTLAAALSLWSCAGAQDATQPPPAPSPPAPRPPAAVPPHPDSSAVSPPKSEEALPPLSAGSDGGLSVSSSGARVSSCAPDTVRKTLESVVAECKRRGQRVCGELKVRASEDGGNIRVALDITNESFDDSFSRCITSRLNGVAWKCTLPGSDTTVDLGCDL